MPFAGFIYTDIESKRRTTAYLHAQPVLIDPVAELAGLPAHQN